MMGTCSPLRTDDSTPLLPGAKNTNTYDEAIGARVRRRVCAAHLSQGAKRLHTFAAREGKSRMHSKKKKKENGEKKIET